nr:ABC transporter ATP-binding protein [uncultured Blautia sp.]
MFVVFTLWTINIFTPYLSGLYIDHLVSGMEINIFVLFVIVIAATNFIQMLFRYLQAVVSTKLSYKMVYQFSNGIFQKIFCSEYKNYSNIDSAYYIDQISKDTNTIVGFFTSNVVKFFLQVATVIMSAVIVFRADRTLSIIILSLIPFYILTFVINKRKMYEAKAQAKQKSNEYFSRYSEQITKISYIKRNVLNHEMEKRLEESFQKMIHAALHSVSVDYIFMNLNQFVIIIAYLCIVGIGGYKVSVGELSIGYFSIINTYFNMIIQSVSFFLGLAGTYQDTKVSFQRIKKIMDEPKEKIGNTVLDNVHKIVVKNLSVQYGEQSVLKNCSYEFYAGKIYGICGQNGGGKTTLLNAIMGLFSGEYSGEIFYDDVKFLKLDMYQMRRTKLSYLEQDPVLFNMSVRDYLQFGIEMNEKILHNQEKLIKIFDIEYMLNKYMNENGANFSGGEKQKLSIIRALSKESSVVLLDEPTSALDKESINQLIGFLHEKKEKAVVLLISHDPYVLKKCDEIIDIQQFKQENETII